MFAAALAVLHEDAFWYSKADRYHYDINHYKDAVDLVAELEREHIPVRKISARALKSKLQEHINGGISLDTKELLC